MTKSAVNEERSFWNVLLSQYKDVKHPIGASGLWKDSSVLDRCGFVGDGSPSEQGFWERFLKSWRSWTTRPFNGNILTCIKSKTFSVRWLNHYMELFVWEVRWHIQTSCWSDDVIWACITGLNLNLQIWVFSVLTLKMDLHLLTFFSSKKSHFFFFLSPMSGEDLSFGLGGHNSSRLLCWSHSLVGHEVMVKSPEEEGRIQAR